MDMDMDMDKDKDNLKLKIDAHVVRQLGEELISDPEQAILELVKNCYDADSPWCSISIDTLHEEAFEEKHKVTGEVIKGKITISDAGCGMTLDQVDRGWLTISHSEKRELKSARKITDDFKRAYQGDKGLGRLSSMKLGRILTIKTSTDGKKGISITLDWDMFQSGYTLDDIPLYVKELDGIPKGTSIEIAGLNNIQHWEGEKAGSKIQSKLSSLIDPFGMDDSFKVTLDIDSSAFPLSEFKNKLLIPTVAQFDYIYSSESLTCKGRVRLPYYMPSSSDTKYDLRGDTRYKRYILGDNGEAFLKRLIEKSGKFKKYEIKRSNKEGWFIEFWEEILWEEMPKDSVSTFENPSPFSSQWNYFYKKGPVYDSLAKGKLDSSDLKAINNLVGVGVYKNNFRVGTNKDDWLGFSTDKTSGSGFYSIRPENVIGFIKFDGYDGESLQEKSDRQGFVENAAHNGFWVVTRAMLKFANDFLNITRREANEYIKLQVEKENDKPESYTAQSAAADLGDLIEHTEKTKKQTKKSEEEAHEALRNAQESIDLALDDLLLDHKSRKEILNLKEKVKLVDSKFMNFKTNYLTLEKSVLKHEYTVEKIITELNNSKNKVEEFYESAAIGLSAENLVHDLNPLLDEISLNAKFIKQKLADLKIKDRGLILKTNQISSTTRVISKDISLLNPMLRSRRNTISEFDVADAVKEYIEIRKEKFESSNISINLSAHNELKIKFVRGKFTQILDNLFRNSEHWLEHLGKHQLLTKHINLEISDSGLFFWDSGPGIYHNMEDVLFEMFETGKSNGQGLGLFIVSTILNKLNCSIELLNERNEFERKYKFYLDLSGAL